ncbi:hypothetical protein ETD83_19890 [Actinomadura soli]|uniref:Uncharacterized protein n=1 Tax=Actinomadura soli TaxID=2508997 RepID=A0A5C4JBG2_9ACTN|nr:hypothetical protein [Actinomadura soli]TMQ97810.1 hypothetical protein ETD83_19890 [Actinomadura soli]
MLFEAVHDPGLITVGLQMSSTARTQMESQQPISQLGIERRIDQLLGGDRSALKGRYHDVVEDPDMLTNYLVIDLWCHGRRLWGIVL